MQETTLNTTIKIKTNHSIQNSNFPSIFTGGFSGLFFPTTKIEEISPHISVVEQEEDQVKLSQDYKRIMKKAKHVDMKLLKSKLKEIKKLKSTDSHHSSRRKSGSNLISIVKKISKFPKPCKIIRDKLMNSEERENKPLKFNQKDCLNEIEINSDSGDFKSSKHGTISKKIAKNRKIKLEKKMN